MKKLTDYIKNELTAENPRKERKGRSKSKTKQMN